MKPNTTSSSPGSSRRAFLVTVIRNAALALLAGWTGALVLFRRARAAVFCRPSGACGGCPAASACGLAVPRRPTTLPVETVWQIDPKTCIQCGLCATECVLSQSAVRCFHTHALCGYCKLCFGYFQPNAPELTSAAENQVCPTGAIRRKFVEDPFYEYTIDHTLCIGCGKCVKGCNLFGNGSLYLQIRQDLCLQCNDCSIARSCPSGAIRRIPADHPYLLKENPTHDIHG